MRRQLRIVFGVTLIGMMSLSVAAQRVKPKNSLHDMAKKAGGHFVLRYRPSRTTIYADVEELAKRSDLIIVGQTLGHRSSLRPDGNFITKDYLVKVQEVIKGDLGGARSILVTVPGGTYRFPDGTFATVKPLGEREVEDRQTCVFFLRSKKVKGVFNGYLLVSETQGLFSLANGNTEPVSTFTDHPVVVKYRGMGAAEFLKEIHKAVPRNKKR